MRCRIAAGGVGVAAGALSLALAGCVSQSLRDTSPLPQVSTSQAQQAQAARAQWFAQARDWSLTGRAAIGRAGKGGSGRLEWTQSDNAYSVVLSAPITRQSWRLSGDSQHKAGRLEGLDGGPREGADARQLLLEATGWDVPVNELPQWMLGFAAPGYRVDELRYAADGRPTLLRQAGWTIAYTRWAGPEGARPALPARIEARRDDASVRLIVDDWRFPTP
ncbi:MAG: lipoprotein insertase outer membrane protein LolB [Luteimonas sp.]